VCCSVLQCVAVCFENVYQMCNLFEEDGFDHHCLYIEGVERLHLRERREGEGKNEIERARDEENKSERQRQRQKQRERERK